MTAILKSHETIHYIKKVVSIKGARSLFLLAFYLSLIVVTCCNGGQRGISEDNGKSCGKCQVHTG